jgi:hypothetical protein
MRQPLACESLEVRTVPSAAPVLGLPYPAGTGPNIYVVTTTATPSDQVTGNLVKNQLQYTFSAAYGGYLAANKDGAPMSLYEAVRAANVAARPNPSGEVILFDLVGKGPFVFKLPYQTGYAGVSISANNVTVNGYSQGNVPGHKATTVAMVNSSATADDAHIQIQIKDRFALKGQNDRILGVSLPGVDIAGGHAFIAGDFIGITPGGESMNAPLDGITIGQPGIGGHGSSGNIIGTALPADRNAIGGYTAAKGTVSSGNGIGIFNGSSGNTIENNLLGKNVYGIHFDATNTTGNMVRGNMIVLNTGAAIRADGGTANTFTGNIIGGNGTATTPPPGAGIVLAAGANNSIAPPLFDRWDPTTLSGHLASFTPAAVYKLDFFNNPTTDPAGRYEGELPWATRNITPDSHGNFTINMHEPVVGGLTATITDANGNTSAFSLPTDFNILGASANTVNFAEGTPRTNVVVGTIIQDGNPHTRLAALQATIDWGDGATSVVTSQPSAGGRIVAGPGASYQIRGNHMYAEDGAYHIHITVRDLDTGAHNSAINTPVAVAESDLAAVPVAVTATEGLPFSGNVGAFVDPGSSDGSSQFTAHIDWGDGVKTTGTVVQDSPGHFHVLGSHTYAEEGKHTIRTTVSETGLAVTPAIKIASKAVVVDAPIHVTFVGGVVPHVEGAALTDTIATFSDDDPGGDPADYTATITWGDGSTTVVTSHASPAGQIVRDPGVSTWFDVVATHTYAEQQLAIPVQVQVKDAGGAVGTGAGTMRIDDAPLTPARVTFTAIVGHSYTGVVAQFTDADPFAAWSDFSVTIHWGDGTTSTASRPTHTVVPATVGGKPGFAILGTHTYSAAGPVAIIVDIIDEGGASAIVSSSANVTTAVTPV